MHYMTDVGSPPAKLWFKAVISELALRGWSKTELSDRSHVARTTIDNWRTNSRRPSAKAVNAVADVLGIDRARAHVLAGIVPDCHGPAPGLLPEQVADAIEAAYPGWPEMQEAVRQAIERTAAGGRPEAMRRRARSA